MNSTTEKNNWIIACTGASGIVYALRLIEVLLEHIDELHIVFSEAALRVLADECDLKLSQSNLNLKNLINKESDKVFFYNPKDIGAKIASGTALFRGMVVVPCSMGSLASIANGISANLIHRAADVTLKEGRELILVPRETPLSAIHLENMLKLSRLGVKIIPAMPGFYLKPKTLEDIVEQQVCKIMDSMRIYKPNTKRWTGE